MSEFAWEFCNFDSPGALPLFIDLQMRGFAGVNFSTVTSADDIHLAAKELLHHGVGAFQVSITSGDSIGDSIGDIEQRLQAISLIESVRRQHREGEAEILGIHLDKPIIKPQTSRDHPAEHIRSPDLELLTRYLTAGVITSITLSPELEEAIELVKFLSATGVRVSLESSVTDSMTSRAIFQSAVKAGASSITHRPGTSLENLLNFVEEEQNLFIEIAVGDVGFKDEELASLFALAKDRIIAITGSSSETQGAGRARSLRSGFERLLALGCSGEDGVMACATTPARYMDRSELGELEFYRLAQRMS
jgi:hypothetical protein